MSTTRAPRSRARLRAALPLLLSALAAAACAPRGPDFHAASAPGPAADPASADFHAAFAGLPTGFPRACGPDQVEVMLLGTFHFQGSATDAVSGTPLDVREPARQRELEELARRLAGWAPDLVAVEWPLSFADSTTARYRRYVESGGETASQNEVVQVGFRLARLLGHPTVHPIDHQMLIGNDSLGALLERRPDLQAQAAHMLATLRARLAESERVHAGSTMIERLRHANTEEALRGGNSLGMFGSYLAAGEGENRGGPQLLARWYERNFHMAHNLTRVVQPGTRRVLLLVGSGHVPPLRNILDEAPQFCPVSPLPFLD